MRVRGEVRDQLVATGHADRGDDIDRLASLGVTGIRQPVLWGWRASGAGDVDWTWADRRLERLRSLNVEPVIGLLHHGAGPDGRTLLDPDMPAAFAAYARRVAERYPWVEHWMPINEPATTARFAGLYGWWEPHRSDDAAFAAIVVNQCRAIRAAMRAIRGVIPSARLIVNDDVGKTFSTPLLRYQAEFDSERRWLALDLLTGTFHRGDLLWPYLDAAGQSDRVRGLIDDPEPPDAIGLDYYVTSDRFLDERLDRYPASTWGGNGRHRYADVEVARVANVEFEGWQGRIAEAADRYGLPLALTEVSMAGEELDRAAWFGEAWDAACDARRRGIDVISVTAWAAFGASGWESLLVDRVGKYEPGVFDTTGRDVVRTPLADILVAAAAGDMTGPSDGWWRQPSRVLYPAA